MIEEKKHWSDVVRAVTLIKDQRPGRMLNDEIGILWAADRLRDLEEAIAEWVADGKAMEQRIRELEAKLERVRRLPAEWRGAWELELRMAADDLEEALGDE